MRYWEAGLTSWDQSIPVDEGKMTWFDLVSLARRRPQDIEWQLVGEMVKDTSRKNDKRPAILEIYTSDAWVQNLRGDSSLKDIYLLTRIPREIVREAREKRSKETKETPVLAKDQPSADPSIGLSDVLSLPLTMEDENA